MDYNLAMGLHLASFNELNEDTDYIFGGGSADSWYVKQVKDKLDKNPEVAQQFGGKKISTHSVRKGSATMASSTTTSSAPIASIMHRGDWTMGVLDRYFKFGDVQ